MRKPQAAGFLILLVVVLAVAAGCGSGGSTGSTEATAESGSSSQPSGETVQLAFFNPIGANSYTAALLQAVEEAAAAEGATVKAFDAEFDQSKQIEQIEDAITTGQYDAFIVMPVNGAVLGHVTSEAIEAGIKVAAVWNNIGSEIDSIEPQVDGISTVVAQQLSVSGRLIGEAIVEQCEGIDPCEAAYMPGSFKIATEKVRLDALEEVVGEASNVKLIASAEGGYLPDPAFKAANEVLLAHEGLKVFATSGDQMMAGILKAVEEAGKANEIALIGNGASTEGVQWVREGKMVADPVSLPASEGVKVTELIVQAANGEEVPESVNALELSPIGEVATKQSLSTPEGRKFKGEFKN
jgi:ribose transport system substrate-binding protein